MPFTVDQFCFHKTNGVEPLSYCQDRPSGGLSAHGLLTRRGALAFCHRTKSAADRMVIWSSVASTDV
jgi:hypothetical protein